MASLQAYQSHGRRYYRIVESFRQNGKPRLRVLVHLGRAEDVLRLVEGQRSPLRVASVSAGAVTALYALARELDVAGHIGSGAGARRPPGTKSGMASPWAKRCWPGSSAGSAPRVASALLPVGRADLPAGVDALRGRRPDQRTFLGADECPAGIVVGKHRAGHGAPGDADRATAGGSVGV